MTDQIRCPRCRTGFRDMDVDLAATLYQCLKSRLTLVSSWGCYVPKRKHFETGDHAAWPLHFWRGPGTPPVVVEWSNKGTAPTFTEFCQVYGLNLIGANDSEV
jgi:hypothetical protein